MRLLLIVPVALGLAAPACNAKPADPGGGQHSASAARSLVLKAADGVAVHGQYYAATQPKALILLFHQAGSSKDEYATIAPRLVAAGYSAMAIDQRAGGELFGRNETAAGLGHKADYLEALPDLQAALDWAHAQKLPIVLWGSSYSASLIFPLAAGDPAGIKALLSFSPGEYFDDKAMVRRAAAKVKVPVLVASTNSSEETSGADAIMAVIPKTPLSMRFVPANGVHGSSTLIASRNPAGAAENWKTVLSFLGRVTASR